MGKRNVKDTIKLTVIGGILFVVIMVAGTIWAGRKASSDSLDAVRKVSLLFMEEMTARREQVVASTLADYIKDLDVAIGLISKEDLADQESLQNYQTRMKQLYALEKFAFVDENGIIHTSRGTRTDIDTYAFDYKTITGPEISIRNVNGDEKKIVIAVPVDRLPYEGIHLLVCFMEMDMETMLESISFESKDAGSTTFCNIYTKDGTALTNVVLGGLASENNLLDALANATYDRGYSHGAITEDFKNGRQGEISFKYNNIEETLYYIPIDNTDWVLTYLIRESVISDQIGSISLGIIKRSLMMSILAALMLIAVFAMIVMEMKKSATVAIEKEKAEAENRVRQEELEEQLALQEELLQQEQKRVQQDQMITALASDYRSVYYVNLNADECICYRNDSDSDELGEGSRFSFKTEFTKYANEYVDEKYRDEFLSFIEPKNIRAALKEHPLIGCRYLIKRDGKESYEMLRLAGVGDNDGQDNGVISAVGAGFCDIDSEMRDSMEKSQALSDALKVAEEASKAKTTFLSNMSHEIRTPMNAIIGLDSLALNEKDLPDTVRDYLEKIGSSAQHLLSLINDILDMSRIESGRMIIRNEEFSFSKLMEQINIIISGQCAEKGVDYNCHINGELNAYYIGDSIKLRQVLINILGNAVKFTPPGKSVEFLIEKAGGYDGKSTLRFVIRDTGVGMSKEFLPKLFETFSQENSSAANKYGSSGLGMAITKNIVDMMNGNIDVQSEKGVGTTFTVTLTLNDSDRNDEATDIEIRPQEMNVLVVDDDPVACDHAKLILGNAGIATEIALSGSEAIEKVKLRHARREPYNLIIIDWKMPEMDGVETTKTIRSEIGDESAIIILTAYNWDDVLDEGKKAGVDSFIAKPLFTENLLDEFKAAIKKKEITTRGVQKKAELKGRRILLAEDMIINAQIMIKVLTMREIETEHAENGKLALEMFEKSEPWYYDAILMDMRMPEMTGLEATAAIRALERPDAKTIPIIALTANAFDEDVQRSLQAGMNAHLSKPVEPNVLFETLEELL